MSDDAELAAKVRIDPAIISLVRRHSESEFAPLHPNPGVGVGVDLATFSGFSVALKNGAEAESLMDAIVPELAAVGCRAFWSERRESSGMKDTDEVMVLKTDDPYAAVRLRGTDGANIGVHTNDVIDRLQSWRELCEFRVVGASNDWVAMVFETLPERICAFAEDVFLFCPDSVGQGVGLIRESEEPERFARARTLCPEVSDRVLKSKWMATATATPDFSHMDPAVAEQFRALLKAVRPLSTPIDMGVRLLADEIRSTRFLSLWWD